MLFFQFYPKSEVSVKSVKSNVKIPVLVNGDITNKENLKMSEQVINIRDRIEKMRTQMTGPNESVARNKIDFLWPHRKG